MTLDDWEPLAKERLDPMAYAYLVGGAGDEVTLRGNREGFARIRLRPRMLVDVSRIDTSTVLFGQTLKIPVLLAPVAYQKIIHPEGELEAVRGANAAGIPFVASTSATTVDRGIAREATVAPWFQLYGSYDREFTKDLVDRARESGCTVLCFTVDAPVRGQRDRDTRVGFRLPPGIERPNFRDLNPQARAGNPRAEGRSIYSPNLDPKLTWEYFEWLRSVAKMPIVLKGIVTAEDAGRAVSAGVDGIVVSNHGGRVIDTVIPAIEALPEIVEATEGGVPDPARRRCTARNRRHQGDRSGSRGRPDRATLSLRAGGGGSGRCSQVHRYAASRNRDGDGGMRAAECCVHRSQSGEAIASPRSPS